MNLDPTGALPAEDSSGRLTLTESNATYAQGVFATFLSSCFVIYSALFWYAYLFDGGAPQINGGRERAFGFLGILFAPFLPLLFLSLLYPNRLFIDDGGITLRRQGRVRRLSWTDITEIRLDGQRTDRFGNSRTITTVSGPQMHLTWRPIFGVAPDALADYLATRRQKFCGGSFLTPTSIGMSQDPISAKRSAFDRKIVLPALIFLGLVCAVALLALFAYIWAVIH